MSGDEKCVKKMNKLTYSVPKSDHRDHKPCKTFKFIHKPSICRIKSKPIRICTAADMKKMVPPNICVCKPHAAGAKGLLGFLLFGIKVAVAAAAIYVSYDLGVWGTIDETQEMYRTYCAAKKGPQKRTYFKWTPPSCEAERSLHRPGQFNAYSHCDASPIDMEKSGVKWKNCWNSGVEAVFFALAGFPHNLIGTFKHGFGDKGEGKLQVTSCQSSGDLSEETRMHNKYK